jgi:hypothetical protein
MFEKEINWEMKVDFDYDSYGTSLNSNGNDKSSEKKLKSPQRSEKEL